MHRVVVITLLITAVVFPLSSQESTIVEGIQWLESNDASPETAIVLSRTARAINDPIRSAELVETFLEDVITLHERSVLALWAARQYDLVHDYAGSERLYAAAIEADALNWNAMIGRSISLQELGRSSESIPLLTHVIGHADTVLLQRRAAELRLRAHIESGNVLRAVEQAYSLIQGDDSDAIGARAVYMAREAALAGDDRELLEYAEDLLEHWYPDSPEYALARGLISFPPVPSRLLTGHIEGVSARDAPREEQAVAQPSTTVPERHVARGVQTGSFRDEENAFYMKRDLEALGFTVEIVESAEGFFRVVIPVAEGTSQNTVIRLKEHGYEGFLLFN